MMLSPFRCMPAGDETANGTGRYKERRIPQQRRRIQGPAAAYRAVVPFFQVVEAQAADSVRDDGVQRAGQEARFVRLSQADDAADVQRADPRMMQDASQPAEEGCGEVPVEDQGLPVKACRLRRIAAAGRPRRPGQLLFPLYLPIGPAAVRPAASSLCIPTKRAAGPRYNPRCRPGPVRTSRPGRRGGTAGPCGY